MLKTNLQLILFISMIGLAINFVTTLEIDYYYNVINREIFIAKACIFFAMGVYLTYTLYD